MTKYTAVPFQARIHIFAGQVSTLTALHVLYGVLLPLPIDVLPLPTPVSGSITLGWALLAVYLYFDSKRHEPPGSYLYGIAVGGLIFYLVDFLTAGHLVATAPVGLGTPLNRTVTHLGIATLILVFGVPVFQYLKTQYHRQKLEHDIFSQSSAE